MNRIEKELTDLGNTIIPSKLRITDNEADGFIGLILDGRRVQKENMQKDGNDFEGWAISIHLCAEKMGIKKKVRMDIDEKKRFVYEKYKGNGHLGRFLYRAMKFSRQYGDWFELSDYLKEEVNKFETYLENGTFVNNIASGAAGSKKREVDENAVEERMAEPGLLRKIVKNIDIGVNSVYRQLPVGLFDGKVSTVNRVFTGGSSAIDLWTESGDEITVVELKTKNVMMGIVTEIFFYSNYVFDLLRDDGLFKMSEPPKGNKELRGYRELYDDRPKKVNGIMLADDNHFHPWVLNGICEVLNDNGIEDLNYYIESYPYKDIIG